ncbi:MAG: hypothetical protein II956_01540 [Bacteroidales bacterium]|nr:hypothetical protein [Bacteroidales bacterium]
MNKNYINILIFSLLIVSCSDSSDNVAETVIPNKAYSYDKAGQIDGYDYQDLGLSVKWATKNLGADNYYDAGYYISWGETSPKGEYTWETYLHYDLTTKQVTKYDEIVGNDLPIITLEAMDDAATVNMGSKWRMPTDEEITELRTKCEWTFFQTDNGNIGYVVTGPNGKNIFIPTGGYMKKNQLKMFNKSACFWSSNLSINFVEKAYELTAYNSSDNEVFRYEGVAERYYGEPIRAVVK